MFNFFIDKFNYFSYKLILHLVIEKMSFWTRSQSKFLNFNY
jgi:hypothetical protein